MIFIGYDISQITDPINFPLAIIGGGFYAEKQLKRLASLSAASVCFYPIANDKEINHRRGVLFIVNHDRHLIKDQLI